MVTSEQDRCGGRLPGWLALILTLAGLLGSAYGSPLSATTLQRTRVDTIPDLRGMQATTGERILGQMGIKVDYAYLLSGGQPGTIVRQIPAAGTVAVPGTEGRLWVVAQSNQPVVPSVIGESLEMARARFAESGIRVGRIEPVPIDVRQYNQPPAAGSVVRQVPEAGTALPSRVIGTLWVAEYTNPGSPDLPTNDLPTQIVVPDVVGVSPAGASRVLAVAGLVLSITERVPSTVADGTIANQWPPAGSAASRGDTVLVRLSLGQTGETPPDGQTDPFGPGQPDDQVTPDDQVIPDDQVDPDEVDPDPAVLTVPDVVGMSVSAAIQALSFGGLLADTPDGASTSEAEVVDQFPAAGSAVLQGSSVRLVIQSEGAGAWWAGVWTTWGLPGALLALFGLARLHRVRKRRAAAAGGTTPETDPSQPEEPPAPKRLEYRLTRRTPVARTEVEGRLLPELEFGLRANPGRAISVTLTGGLPADGGAS